jgi:hypothetical protein
MWLKENLIDLCKHKVYTIKDLVLILRLSEHEIRAVLNGLIEEGVMFRFDIYYSVSEDLLDCKYCQIVCKPIKSLHELFKLVLANNTVLYQGKFISKTTLKSMTMANLENKIKDQEFLTILHI